MLRITKRVTGNGVNNHKYTENKRCICELHRQNPQDYLYLI